MANYKKRADFFTSEEGVTALKVLNDMVASADFKTDASYSANAILHPDNSVAFVDKHMRYLHDNPKVNARHYISNLRLMMRIR